MIHHQQGDKFQTVKDGLRRRLGQQIQWQISVVPTDRCRLVTAGLQKMAPTGTACEKDAIYALAPGQMAQLIDQLPLPGGNIVVAKGCLAVQLQ